MIADRMFPNTWMERHLGEVLDLRTGSIDPVRHPDEIFELYSMPAYDAGSAPEVVKGTTIGSSKKQVFSGDVLFARLNPRIPRVWVVESGLPDRRKLASTDFVVLVDKRRTDGSCWFDPSFLRYQLLSPAFRSQVTAQVQGATGSRQRLSPGSIESANLGIPGLDTQRRIVARLDALMAEVAEARRLHAEIAADTERIMEAAIREVFAQSTDGWQTRPLSEVAFIQTGTAKGRDFRGRKTVEMPYLRVANVQAGHLDLSEIKTIPIAENEIERYRLQPGDLLLTEGGDFDKLGRGAVWHGEIEPCIHQNHIFAVRFDPSLVQPKFAEYEMLSWHAKSYFLGVAKKTTNLATINRTQLAAFPMLFPKLSEQQRIVAQLDSVKQQAAELRVMQAQNWDLLTETQQAILAEAFRGAL